MDLSPAEAAQVQQLADLWGVSRDEAATRMVREVMKQRYVIPRMPAAKVVPFLPRE
jgi:hypothetical protein